MGLQVSIYVSPKQGVHDPAGQAVLGALKSLGFDEVADIRIGKHIVLQLNEGPGGDLGDRVQEMCERLLANPLIEDYRIDLGPGSST